MGIAGIEHVIPMGGNRGKAIREWEKEAEERAEPLDVSKRHT